MAYNKTTWIDDVTPLDAAHLNNMEDGIEKMYKATINGKVLSDNPSLSAADVGALPASTEIPIVDKSFSPTSANAQSGKAVAEAVDPRTVYQKFIDDNKLKQRNWVDLSFVGGEYYYTDFLQAVADVNADTTENSTTDSTSAVCQIFKNEEITVLRLLSDLSVTTPIIFTKSIIFDINGFTISLSENGVFGKDEIQEKLTIVYYGAKINSTISATNVYSSILLNSQYTYILGGIYVSLQNDDISFQDKYARYVILSETDGIFDCVFEVANCDIKIESTSQIQEAVGIHINRGADATDKINCLISNLKIIASNINSETVTTNKISAFALWFDDRATQTKNLINVKCENSTIKGLSIESGDYTANSMGAYCACHCLFENCNLIGIHSGISLGQNVCYLKNCICISPIHGGMYVNSGATVYIDSCEFYHKIVNDVLTAFSSAAYFANGSVSYINNSSFIIESGVSTPEGITIKGNNKFPATKVYLSNCYLPNIRCDRGHYVYLGEGINETIQNVTVNGTKILTTENYSSDNDNKTIIDIEYKPTSRSPQSGIAVSNAIANEIGKINDILATVVNGGAS